METADEYVISTDPERLDLDWVHRVLSTDTYWAPGRPKERVAQALEHSVCYGLYEAGDRQVGFARLVTDRTVFAWLGDVYIDRSVRGRGLSKRLIEQVVADVEDMQLRRIILSTDDADGLYRKFGFTDLDREETVWLQRLWPDHK
ncbi:GNAT family N-acetyltransferase [Glycomyces harbinensis]|uniref:N-acetylglutamate synthase, GNAT family n=1 Tax=Glycomyces harbinensis TaxID=58114 RepID=A0A1G6XD66_9ACTN|nr:GNAT family N-acetyltransferase [Glycomyces harbinensis]SDD76108.1 N-acetylglutamate synthase, GNAT family [Glycomyces harbinensis]